MGLRKDDLGRRFLLDVTRDGAVFVRERGKGPCPHGGLPVFSTDTREEADDLIVHHCKLARNGTGIYRLNEGIFPRDAQGNGNVDNLEDVTVTFRLAHEKMHGARG